MKVSAQKFSFTIADKAINNLAENPFKFPKPSNVKPRMDAGDGRMKPNVSFCTMMEYLYIECLRHMLKKFKQNMLDTFDKLEDGSKLEDIKSGHTSFKRSIYMYPWDIQCCIVSLNANLTVADMDIVIAELRSQTPQTGKDFSLEILNAEFRPRAKNETLQVKGTDLTTQRTK